MLRLYLRFIVVYIKTLLEYRFLFFMDIFLQIVTYGLQLGSIWILINRFQNINGWTFDELLLLYTFDLCSYALSGMFFKHPMLDMEEMIRTGSFDGILTKPMNTLFHVVARQFQHGFIGHTVMCVFTFAYCFRALNIELNAIKIFLFLLFLLGASLLQAAFMIFSGSMCFFFVKSTSVVETAIYSIRSFLNYPITVYGHAIQIFLTFIIPYAFVNFYPAEYFLSYKENALFHPLLQYLTPVIGLGLFFGAVCFWRYGVSKYQSTGS